MLYRTITEPVKVRRYPHVQRNVKRPAPPEVGKLKAGEYVIAYQELDDWLSISRAGDRWIYRPATELVTHSLVGVHGTSGQPTSPADIEIMRQCRLEAVKLVSADEVSVLPFLRQELNNPLIIVRIYIEANRYPLPAWQYLIDARDIVLPWVAAGVRFFEIANEPNLTSEGWKWNWKDGAEFNEYYWYVLRGLQLRFPNAYFGYPALSPHWTPDPQRTDDTIFYGESAQGALTSDFIALHAYWTDKDGLTQAINYVNNFNSFGLPVFVTECGNPFPGPERGAQYLHFYRQCQVAAVCPFLISSRDYFHDWTWLKQNGSVDPLVTAIKNR